MKRIGWLLFIFIPVFVGCVNKNSNKDKMDQPVVATLEADTLKDTQGSYYFSGDFMYFADAPTFKDCVTEAVLPVAMKGVYKDVEKKYQKLKLNDPEGVYCEVMGYLINKPAGEEGHPQQLVITSLIQFDRTSACHIGNVTNCTYVTESPDEKNPTEQISLVLKPDYTFQMVTKAPKAGTQTNEVNGTWRRTSDENIVFLTNQEVYYQGIIDFTNMNLKLDDNNGKLWNFKKSIQ